MGNPIFVPLHNQGTPSNVTDIVLPAAHGLATQLFFRFFFSRENTGRTGIVLWTISRVVSEEWIVTYICNIYIICIHCWMLSLPLTMENIKVLLALLKESLGPKYTKNNSGGDRQPGNGSIPIFFTQRTQMEPYIFEDSRQKQISQSAPSKKRSVGFKVYIQ